MSCGASGDMWSDAATSVMEELVSGVILFAVVVSYTEDYVPLINLYRRDKDQVSTANHKQVREGGKKLLSLHLPFPFVNLLTYFLICAFFHIIQSFVITCTRTSLLYLFFFSFVIGQ